MKKLIIHKEKLDDKTTKDDHNNVKHELLYYKIL